MRQPIQHLDIVPLFGMMRAELLLVLSSLDDAGWFAPTACEGWTVKDVALHLLSDDMGFLSRHRDKDGYTIPFETWDELVEKINAYNQLWVHATRRLSRRLLLSLLESMGEEVNAYFAEQIQSSEQVRVSWAGSGPKPMWLQVARELTEYWMHHQHICEAVGVRSLKDADFMRPILTAFAHALPHTFRDTVASIDTLIKVVIENVVEFHLVYEADGWKLYSATDLPATTTVHMDADTAWKLFTKGISPEEASQQSQVEGDAGFAQTLFKTVAIIA